MQHWIKFLWVLTILVNLSGAIWYTLCSTANFQRGLDIIATAIFVCFVFPSIVLVLFSFYLFYKRWSPTNWWETVGVLVMIGAMVIMITSKTCLMEYKSL